MAYILVEKCSGSVVKEKVSSHLFKIPAFRTQEGALSYLLEKIGQQHRLGIEVREMPPNLMDDLKSGISPGVDVSLDLRA